MSEKNSRALGQRLQAQRKKLGLTQKALAEQLGVHTNTQSKYESGDRMPDADYVSRANALGLDMGYVLGGIAEVPHMTVRSRLVDLPETYASDVLADYWQVLAWHLEQSMLQAGAVPNQDYVLKDLFQLTQPLVVARMSELRLDVNQPKGLGRSD